MDHRRLNRKYKSLLGKLTEKLGNSFPLAPDMPADEYSPEAQLILARLKETDSPEGLAGIIREVFVSQFDEGLAASFSGYDEVAQWLWETSRDSVF